MSAPYISVAPMRNDQLADATGIMVRAFSDDPIFLAGFPDPAERALVMPLAAAWNFRHGRMFGEILVAGDPPAGALIAYRAVSDSPFSAERVAASLGDLRMRLGDDLWAKWERMQGLFTAADAQLEAALSEPHWYVDMIAVEPARQGTGIGRALLEAVHARADAEGWPTALLTFRARNLPIYERMGYELVGVGPDPRTGFNFWCFRRRVR